MTKLSHFTIANEIKPGHHRSLVDKVHRKIIEEYAAGNYFDKGGNLLSHAKALITHAEALKHTLDYGAANCKKKRIDEMMAETQAELDVFWPHVEPWAGNFQYEGLDVSVVDAYTP